MHSVFTARRLAVHRQGDQPAAQVEHPKGNRTRPGKAEPYLYRA